jgi:hypothetical protein
MSVVRKAECSFVDMDVLRETVESMGGELTVAGNFRRLDQDTGDDAMDVKVFSRTLSAKAAIKLKGWSYAIAVMHDGSVQYDNHNGHWGSDSDLQQLMQRYGENYVTRSVNQSGRRIVDRAVQNDGSIRLVVRR